jgi:RecA-family ATPase
MRGKGSKRDQGFQNQADDAAPFSTVKISDVPDAGPPKYLVDRLLLDNSASIVGALPKSLKSFFTMYCAVHVAGKVERKLFGEFAVKRGRVVVFNAEDTAPLTRHRIAGICRSLGAEVSELDLHLIDTSALFVDNPEHLDRLRRTVDALKPTLLILDPLRNLHGLDENDSRILPLALNPLSVIKREFGCSVQVIHHLVKDGDGKSAASRLRGTGAIRGCTTPAGSSSARTTAP